MTPQVFQVFALLAACMLAFIANKPRMDVVALIAILVLVLGGTLTLEEALAGFSDPSVLLIAAFFVIGEGLTHTGIANRVGEWLAYRAGGSESRLLVLLMLSVAGLGAFMSSTAVVAIFIPVALGIAARLQIAPGRLMMPLSFAGLISGMLTLVATPPNLVVNSELARTGHHGFHFFSFTPMGLLILALGIVYMLVAQRWLVVRDKDSVHSASPRRSLHDLVRDYALARRACRLHVQGDSLLVGHTLDELHLRNRFGANVIGIERKRRFQTVLLPVTSKREILAGDVLLVDFFRSNINLDAFCNVMHLTLRAFKGEYFTDGSKDMGLAEVLIPPDSVLTNKSVLEIGFRTRYGLNVVGLRRHGQARTSILQTRLDMGDTLLVAGPWKSIRQLQAQSADFLVLRLPAESDEAAPESARAPFALGVLAFTVALMVSGLVPNVIAAFIGCLLMGAFRCIDLDSAYRAIHWQSLILIVGMLPFATALHKTGGIDHIVDTLLHVAGGGPPQLLLGALFVLTAVVGLFVSNTATAVLMAPIAVATATQIGASPLPFAMTVAISASAAFMTPISSPVNTLVLVPGQYRFGDYVKIGVPFTVLVGVACMLLLPWLFPLYPE
jgi:di/tricarboxylate transporter